MDINAGWVGAATTVFGALSTMAGAWVKSALATRDEAIQATKNAQKLLFEKSDVQTRELQEYKLHVAETYVNQAALQKMLDPIDRRLENIEKDLRGRSLQ